MDAVTDENQIGLNITKILLVSIVSYPNVL